MYIDLHTAEGLACQCIFISTGVEVTKMNFDSHCKFQLNMNSKSIDYYTQAPLHF